MKEVYLYFRTIGTIGDDDAAGDSALYPLSSFKGMVPSADDTLNLYFTPAVAVMADGQDGAVVNNDKIVVSLSSNNTHKTVMADLARLFSGAANGGIHHDGYIDVADDITGTYAVSGINGLSTMTAPTLS
mgnify:CR=1 FL=1|tara:strand:- start:16 stop:405 length:390 start_codon:yes stop_codon:yes gene_type:complete